MSELEVVTEDLRWKSLWRGKLLLAYNRSHLTGGDFYKSKPNWYSVSCRVGARRQFLWPIAIITTTRFGSVMVTSTGSTSSTVTIRPDHHLAIFSFSWQK